MPLTKNSLNSKINGALFFIYIIIILLFALNDNSSGMGFNTDKIQPFNQGWTVFYNDTKEENVVFPQNYHLEPGTTYYIERTINKSDFIYPVVKIRSSMMDVHAYVDNKQIYSFDVSSDDETFNKPYPASWHLIDIPMIDSIGKTLKITFSSPTTQFSGLINSIFIGEGEAILLHLIHRNVFNFVVSLFIILFSIFALISLFWIKKLGITKHILYLASFGIASGLWIISEATLLQILVPNRFVVSSTSYVLNLVLPLIIVLFFRDIVLEGYKKVTTLVASGIIALLFVELILQLSGTVTLISSTILSIIMIIITSVVLIYCLIDEGYKKHNAKAKQYLFIFLSLFAFALIIISLFVLKVYQNLGIYLSLGVFGFYFLVMIDAIKSIHKLILTKNKAKIYKQLAYEDYLTKGRNRTAFEQDIEKLIQEKTTFRLVLLDLNYLKQINDTYGHPEGDYAIIESYNSIQQTVQDSGKSYRISGDEFACIIFDTRDEIFEKYKKSVEQILKEKSSNKPYDIVLAIGTKIYTNNESFTAFYKKVDTEMYKHKAMLKKQQNDVS